MATVVIGGITTNIGVKSTALEAHEHGYARVLAEDATAIRSAAMHAFAFEHKKLCFNYSKPSPKRMGVWLPMA